MGAFPFFLFDPDSKHLKFIYNFLVPKIELMFLETSALTGENVEEAFLQCSKIILSKIETGNKEFCLFIAIKMLMNE